MTFTHLDAGTPEHQWRAAGVADLPEAPGRGRLTADTLLVVVVAHPDDETLGATGLIRSVLAAGGRVAILVATAGEGSHPDSPTHTPEQLVALRSTELDAAAAALGAGYEGRLGLRLLGLPDGGLAGHAAEVRRAVEAVLDGHDGATGAGGAESSDMPGNTHAEPSVLLATHYRADGHTDHDALGRTVGQIAVERGLELYEFPIWFWHWAEPERDADWRAWTRWPLTEEDQGRRREALSAHASQVRPLSPAAGDEAILGPGMLEHVTGRTFDVYRHTAGDRHTAPEGATEVFDRLYREHDDPWRYRSSWYERRKRLVTLAALPREHYGTVVEAGSSIGVLTAELADRADRVIGLEASGVALEAARRSLADRPEVHLMQSVLPDQWPEELSGGGTADLVVISEVGYFLSRPELERLLDACERSLALSGHLVLCHWRQEVEGWPLDGDDVHALVGADPRFRPVSRHVEPDFAVEVYARAAAADRVAVVVPARDEEELLPRCLRALGRAADRWEEVHAQGSVRVVVALDHSTDASKQLAEAFAARDPRFHVLDVAALAGPTGPAGSSGRVGSGGEVVSAGSGETADGAGTTAAGQSTVGRARDWGVRRAVALLSGNDDAHGGAVDDVTEAGTSGECDGSDGLHGDGGARAASSPIENTGIWVASTDADTVVPEDWLVAQTVLAASVHGPVVLAGTVELEASDVDEDTGRRWREHYDHGEDHGHVHGANLGLSWDAYERLGGFPHVAEHEDVALVEAARVADIPVLATDRTRTLTSGRAAGRTPGGFSGFLRDLAEDVD